MSRLHILQHSLGLDEFGKGRAYRNHYCAGSDDVKACEELVDLGLMTNHGSRGQLSGGDPVSTVTDSGREYVRKHSPVPPKLTRSKRRYLAFLQEDSDLSFGEWLKTERSGSAVVA